MKFHSFKFDFALFFVIFFAFILPAGMAKSQNIVQTSITFQNFPLNNLIYFLIAIFVYYVYKEKDDSLKSLHSISFKILLPAGFALSLVFFVSLIFKSVSVAKFGDTGTSIILPNRFISWLYAILTFGFAAFYEEVIYRFYFSEALSNLLYKTVAIENERIEKIIIILSEITCLLFFAVAHSYMGKLSVINAAIAHCIFRVLYKLTGNIYSSFTAHFIYNMISLILL